MQESCNRHPGKVRRIELYSFRCDWGDTGARVDGENLTRSRHRQNGEVQTKSHEEEARKTKQAKINFVSFYDHGI